MKLFVLCLVCLMSQVKAVKYSRLIFEEFKLFKLQYGKTYANPTEEEFRMQIYWENRELIALHNQLYYKGLVTYTMAINQFGDLLHSEYVERLTSYTIVNESSDPGNQALLNPSFVDIPDKLDLRTKGYVTAVKNQGDCNCSYAFAAVGAIEGQQVAKTGNLITFSAQNIIDCPGNYGNQGCKGGNVSAAYDAIVANYKYGVESEDSYPYTGKEGKCNFEMEKAAAYVTATFRIVPRNEANLKCDIARNGTTAVTVDASHDSFRFYSGGVYYEEHCSSHHLNHAMVAVGYDTDAKGGDYWIVKNSWGEGWGDKGYIYMARNKRNNCGIATDPIIPLVKHQL